MWPLILIVDQWSSMKTLQEERKREREGGGGVEPETTHLAEFREGNISITNIGAARRREVEKTPLIDVTLYEKKYWQPGPHSSSGSAVSASYSLHPSSAQPRPLHHESRTNLLTLILSPWLAQIYFCPGETAISPRNLDRQLYLLFSFSAANKGGAVIASDYMKNHLMIPIYNSRLNNDTVKSWQAVINEGSYKTYLVWRLAGDELRSDTNSW